MYKPARLSAICACMLLLLSSAEPLAAQHELSASKPNIIVILTDDMSYLDLSSLGQYHFATPHIDSLLRSGVFFSEAYAGSSECGPSRASLLTGKHMGHSTVRRNASLRGQNNLVEADTTIAEMLKHAGYATGMVGKWGVGLPGTEGVPGKQGFDYSCGFYDQLRAHTYYPHYLMENDQVIPLPGNYGFDMDHTYRHSKDMNALHRYDENGKLIAKGVKDPAKVVNSQDFIQEKALAFIEKNHQDPFFLYYATQLPHGPVITPDLGEFKDKPWDQKHKEWAAMMVHLDRNIGEICATLKEQGVAENTIIFFASDNGYAQWGYFGRKYFTDDPLFRNKGPWKGGKFLPEDGGVRVPFFVSWPGKIKPGYSTEVVSLYDLLPTACDLAGVAPPENDGKSIIPLLNGEAATAPLHEYLYWEGGSFNAHAQSARLKDWFAYREHPDKPVQLWKVSEDPGCLYDVASENPEIVERVVQLFEDEHVPSEWYIDPGDSKEEIARKKQRVKDENMELIQIKANSKYPEELDF